MKVILRSDVSGLGNAGDVIEVQNGYAQNYLVPKGLALRATNGALVQAAAMKRSRDVRDGRDREGAEEVARRLVSAVIKIEARVGSGEQLYGSVTTMEIAEAVKTQTGVELDRRRMNLSSAIKTTGSHAVDVRLHREVQFSLLVEVAAQS